jgi:hypothetical protein
VDELNKAQVVQPSGNICILQNERTILANHLACLAIRLEANLIWQTMELVGSYSDYCHPHGELLSRS